MQRMEAKMGGWIPMASPATCSNWPYYNHPQSSPKDRLTVCTTGDSLSAELTQGFDISFQCMTKFKKKKRKEKKCIQKKKRRIIRINDLRELFVSDIFRIFSTSACRGAVTRPGYDSGSSPNEKGSGAPTHGRIT